MTGSDETGTRNVTGPSTVTGPSNVTGTSVVTGPSNVTGTSVVAHPAVAWSEPAASGAVAQHRPAALSGGLS